MASSSLRENFILNKIILTTDDTNACVKGDTWYQGGILGTLLCENIITRVVGVMKSVAPASCVAEVGV